jgi:hypothetical protein
VHPDDSAAPLRGGELLDAFSEQRYVIELPSRHPNYWALARDHLRKNW